MNPTIANSSFRGLLLCLPLWMVLAGCSDPGAGGADDASAQAVASLSSSGEDTYNRYCFSCHASGVAGAPKTGDALAWGPRIAKGPDLLLEASKNGVPPGMPPMGMCMTCSDEDLVAAIDFMVSRSR